MPASRTSQPPEGFVPFHSSPFFELIGPAWMREEDGPVFGLVVEERHTNTMGSAHGGLLMALVDLTCGRAIRGIVGATTPLVTATLAVEFLKPAPLGRWLEVAATVGPQMARQVAVEAQATVDGVVVARATGSYRILRS